MCGNCLRAKLIFYMVYSPVIVMLTHCCCFACSRCCCCCCFVLFAVVALVCPLSVRVRWISLIWLVGAAWPAEQQQSRWHRQLFTFPRPFPSVVVGALRFDFVLHAATCVCGSTNTHSLYAQRLTFAASQGVLHNFFRCCREDLECNLEWDVLSLQWLQLHSVAVAMWQSCN